MKEFNLGASFDEELLEEEGYDRCLICDSHFLESYYGIEKIGNF